MRGADVRDLQRKLGTWGYHVRVTGVYDRQTLRAVKRFQRARHMHPSGVVGPRTAAVLDAPVPGSGKGSQRPPVTATTFRNFPSFPQRYMEPCTALPVESRVGVKVEPLKRPLQPALYTEGDLHVRQFTDGAARRVARVPFALQQIA